MTSSEDVLLQVGQVRFKKGDGTLYVMNERLAWMMDHRDTVSVSHKYVDIKMQKISPQGKPKIQLQVVLHDGSTSTFQFVNRQGPDTQKRERDNVKELLQQLLAKFKREIDKELEEKNRLLTESPAMLQLYRDLVITQVISSEEFWQYHTTHFSKQPQGPKQEIGVTGAFLADIKPQTDGCNGLKYNLTLDVIECIFKTFPAVKKKHLEEVPKKVTEGEFWTKFFQSHYFHRDRMNGGTRDLFTDCAKQDDIDLNKEIHNSSSVDSLVDLQSFNEKFVDEGYGTGSEISLASTSANVVHQSMIRRFNQHSIMVLKSTDLSHEDVPPAMDNLMNSSQNNYNIFTSTSSTVKLNGYCTPADSPQKIKRVRLQEKISYDDLNSVMTGSSSNHLTINKADRYCHGPLFVPSSDFTNIEDINMMKYNLGTEADGWTWIHRGGAPVTPGAAVSALGELTPGGALMKGFREDCSAQLVSKETELELKNLYLSLCELLRHFWACFPPTNPSLESKAVKMHEAVQRFHAVRLKQFEDRVLRELSPLSHEITNHINQLLNTAYRKFAIWQQRKLMR